MRTAIETMEGTLYEQLADEITRQIDAGTFRPGERIPSVRQTSKQKSVSVTTVLQAYHLLEDRGLIEARPQSGYFVRSLPRTGMPQPEVTAPPLDPQHISVDDLMMRLLQDMKDPGLVQFGAGIPSPDLLPTQKLNRILGVIARNAEIPHHLCGYPEGAEELRVQIAQRAFLAGCSLTPDELIITNGCTEAMNLALRAVCRPGDLVAIESPTYFGVLQMLEAEGLRALEIPTHHATGMSLAALRFALDHHRVSAVLIVTNFNNPLGSLMPDENKRELVEMLAERQIPLIEDDLLGELYFGRQRPTAAKAYDRQGWVMLASSYSKDISPSLRLGWLAPGRFQKQVERAKMATSLGNAIIPQLAVAQFLANGSYDYYLRRMRRVYQQKVAGMSQAIARYFPAETRVTNPAGGFLLWVQLPEKVDSLDLYRQALKAGITLAPGHIFSATNRYRNFIRLNAANWSEAQNGAVQRLGEIVARLAY